MEIASFIQATNTFGWFQDMNTRLRLSIVGLAALVSTQAICAAASYHLQINDSDPECIRFLNAVKASRIADMSNNELCDAIALPVTAIFPSTPFKELDWMHDAAANVTSLAKKTMDATEPLERRAQSANMDAAWLHEVDKLNDAHQIEVSFSTVHLTHATVYAVQLSERVCDASYDEHGPLPLFGFFADSAHTQGIPNPPLAMGRLFYFDGHLASFFLSPRWIKSPSPPQQRLFASMQYRIDDNEDGSLNSGVAWSCTVLIQK